MPLITMVDREPHDGLSIDDVFEILSNARRRYMIDYLHQTGGTATLSEIADQIAAWEYETPVDDVGNDERRRVYISLYQTHLPKLVEYGVIQYDEDTKTARLTGRVADVDRYLYLDEPASGRWWLRYGALAAVAAGLTVGIWLGWYPLSIVSTEAAALLVTAAFIALSAAHYAAHRYGRYRWRLGRQW